MILRVFVSKIEYCTIPFSFGLLKNEKKNQSHFIQKGFWTKPIKRFNYHGRFINAFKLEWNILDITRNNKDVTEGQFDASLIINVFVFRLHNSVMFSGPKPKITIVRETSQYLCSKTADGIGTRFLCLPREPTKISRERVFLNLPRGRSWRLGKKKKDCSSHN